MNDEYAGKSDDDIVALIYERREDGLDAAAQCYGALCRRIAASITGSAEDAEECFNDALLAVWRSIPPQRPRSLSAYICRITRNLALNRRRDGDRQKRGGGERVLLLSELEECCGGVADRAEDASEGEISAVIDRWLERQPKNVRLLFVGRYFEGAEIKTLAKKLGMGEAAARSALHRARLGLRRELESAGIGL